MRACLSPLSLTRCRTLDVDRRVNARRLRGAGFDRFSEPIEDIRVTMEREGGDRFIGEPPGAQALGGYEPSGPP